MTNGMPIWYELHTGDIEAAKRFYGEVVGWTAIDFSTPDGAPPYAVWSMEGAGIAGLTTIGAAGAGWLAYYRVGDVDAKVAEVEAAGGKRLAPIAEMPEVGRMALVADPQGAPFQLIAPDAGAPERWASFSETLPGRAAWNELATTDQAAALAFYAQLLGWHSSGEMPMGPAGEYRFVNCGETVIGATMNRASPDQPVRWTPYFKVADADRAVEQVRASGGRVVAGPHQVPGGQRVVVTTDPQGLGVGFVAGDRA